MTRQRRGQRRAGHGGDSPARHAAVGAAGPNAQRRGRFAVHALLVLGVAMAAAGTTAVGVVTQRDDRSGQPDARAGTERTKTPSGTPRVRGPVLDESTPVSIRIPAIGVRSPLLTLGLRPNGTVEAPPVGRANRAGWYKASPTPGEPGPAVILGYRSGGKGSPAPVFRDLGELSRGDTVKIARADDTVAVFGVDRVARYPATRFPTDEVYGRVDHAGLRLITSLAPEASQPVSDENVVVYASLRTARKAD